MLSLDSPEWAHLHHAYGSAADIPVLLRRAPMDYAPGHRDGCTWFDLWSALCHQGDSYTASYAAVPHLLAIANARLRTEALFDPLHLAACIELSRLEGQGPPIPPELEVAYMDALRFGAGLARAAQQQSWPAGYPEALVASEAAFNGLAEVARAILDRDTDEDAFDEED